VALCYSNINHFVSVHREKEMQSQKTSKSCNAGTPFLRVPSLIYGGKLFNCIGLLVES
jgi:hypothetical protein